MSRDVISPEKKSAAERQVGAKDLQNLLNRKNELSNSYATIFNNFNGKLKANSAHS
jgi:hypothetical protein